VKRAATGDEELLSVYRDHGVVRKSDRDDNFNKASEDLSLYQRVVVGDLVVNKMKAWQGSVAVSNLNGIVSPAYFVFEDTGDVERRFMHYLLRSSPYVGMYRAASKGIRPSQWDLDPEVLRTVPLFLPASADQEAIARFLDRETAEIDAFIADQEELIALLGERRAATISHAVTKGLDPNVPMKDSGIEWLGRVPSHWRVAPIKHVIDSMPGFAFNSDDYGVEGDAIRLLRGVNVGVGQIDWEERVTWPHGVDAKLKVYELHLGDVVVGLDRPVIAKGVRVAMLTGSDLPSLLVQRVLRVRATIQSVAGFLAYVLGSTEFSSYVTPIFTGVSVPHLSEGQVGEFTIAIPPVNEQQRIVDYLGDELAELNNSIADAREAIGLSRERRAALISAAVTGKIDVRGQVREMA
jgi:type I restriction enzyme S subunit